jgi:predicted Zn finger-like uncharacterized protein
LIVQCEKCATKYTVPDEKVPLAGIKAKCKGCGHIMLVSRPVPEPTIGEPPVPALADEESWSCLCGAISETDADVCGACGRPKAGLPKVAAEPGLPKADEFEQYRKKARVASRRPWRIFLYVVVLAVVVGVGASYFLGHVLNRSIATFLAAIFK